MSQARRLAETLESVRAQTQDAGRAAGQHRHRGAVREPFSQRIADLADLVAVMLSINDISKDLAGVAKLCADSVRADYVHGHAPSGGDWPQTVRAAAAEADTALTKLSQHLSKRSAMQAGHNALAELHGYVRDAHRNPHTK